MDCEPHRQSEEPSAGGGKPNRRVAAARWVCAAYASLLTLLLLAPDPLALLGIKRLPVDSQGIGVHFACFAVLGALIAASQLPWRPWLPGGMLACYALTVELLQHFMPPRTVEMKDLAENLLGAAVGTGFWILLCKRTPKRS